MCIVWFINQRLTNVHYVMVLAALDSLIGLSALSITHYTQDRCPGDKRGLVSSVATCPCTYRHQVRVH